MNSATADFEDEMLAINPEYDLIFNNDACPRASPVPLECGRRYSPNKMKIITKMNEIIGQNPIGELPTHKDWDKQESVEKETIALMRKFGLEQSVDRRPDEQRTISTIPTTEDVIIMRNGHKKMSIFMSDSFFALKPRSETVFCLDEGSPTQPEPNTAISEEVTAETSLSSKLSSSSSSTVSTGNAPESKVEYDYISSNNTSSSSLTQSDLSWRRMSVESSESTTDWNCHVKYSNKLRGNKNPKPSTEGNTNRRSSQKFSEALKIKEKGKQIKCVEKDKPKVVEKQVKDVERDAKVEEASVPEIVPKAISNCGSQLYKPRDLFLKKKAMRIQQVLAANQS